ncbi:hypothetical protein RNJ44_02775 [Nakaseomyces bracarensis]|uniref:Uncharacterized protein n=1 Tax=Nakaseomyces bracarensis TaxID=273131 RepID=A0ABR4P077_9SACH
MISAQYSVPSAFLTQLLSNFFFFFQFFVIFRQFLCNSELLIALPFAFLSLSQAP